jgi:hypothetical protein
MAGGERMYGPDLDGCTSDALARCMPKFGGVASTPVWKADLRNLDVYGRGSNGIAAIDDGATSKPAPALFSRVMAPEPCPSRGQRTTPRIQPVQARRSTRPTPSQFMGVGPAWRHRMAFRTADAAPTDDFSRARSVE